MNEADGFKVAFKNQTLLFVAPSAYPLGGLATWLNYLLPGLRKLGWRATLGLVEGPRAHRADEYLLEHPQEDWISIPCRTGTPIGRRRAVQKILSRLQPDLVITVNIPDALIAAAECRNVFGSFPKAVMTCHGIQADLFADMRLLRDSMDAVVCTNRLACRLAIVMGAWPQDRIFHAPYGVHLPTVDDRCSSKELTIAYVGRLEEDQKRIHDLPVIIGSLKKKRVPFRMLVAGTGPEEQKLRQTLLSLDLNEKVEFLGQISAPNLSRMVHSRADVLLMPSRWETGPIVIWEAMARGVPVVSSRYVGSGLEGALKHNDNCLMFEIGNCEAAANLLSELHSDKRLWNELCQNGFNLVREKYSHEASIHRWHEVLTTILSLPCEKLTVPKETNRVGRGRLDHVIGSSFAERTRELLRRTGPDSGPGGEWPHSLSSGLVDEAKFWRIAQKEDRRIRQIAGDSSTSASNLSSIE